jgi:hypothetical protein
LPRVHSRPSGLLLRSEGVRLLRSVVAVLWTIETTLCP